MNGNWRMTMRTIAVFTMLATSGLAAGEPVRAETILFVGNSFTYGANSAVHHYRADSVTDLNGEGVGGVPALFKTFADEAGLAYTVSLETGPGKGLGWHWRERRGRIPDARGCVHLPHLA